MEVFELINVFDFGNLFFVKYDGNMILFCIWYLLLFEWFKFVMFFVGVVGNGLIVVVIVMDRKFYMKIYVIIVVIVVVDCVYCIMVVLWSMLLFVYFDYFNYW